MKLIQRNKSEVEVLGNSSESVEAKLSQESQDFLIYQLSRIYTDPIGSIARELTSNAYDAQIEAGITDKAVRVGFGEDDSGADYVYFQDFGIGMSPEFMKERYMNYGDSTKRDSDGDEDNPLHGMFGFGSKSPFGYVDEYFITTVVGEIEYEYCMYKSEKGKPKLDLLSKQEVSKPNGTEIRIYLKKDSGYTSEKDKWATAFQDQLIYFDNVYFDCGYRMQNFYKNYRYNNFVVSTSPYSSKMSIVYGKAKYPINWNKLSILKPKVEPAIGIIIPIGELEVVPSREEIVYNDYEIQVIENAIKNAFSELEELYSEQIVIHDNIVEYYESKKKNKDSDLAGKLAIKPDNQFEDDHIIDISSITKIRKNYFKLYKEFNISTKNEASLSNIYDFLFEVDYVVSNGKKNSRTKIDSISPLLKSTPDHCYRKQGMQNDPKRNRTINSGYIFKLKRHRKKYIVKIISDLFNLKPGNRLRFSRELYKYILNEVKNKTKSYKDVQPTIDKVQRDTSSIVYYNCNYTSKVDQKSNSKVDNLISLIESKKSLTVYGNNDQLPLLKFLQSQSYKLLNSYKDGHNYWFITTAKRNIKHIENIKNTISLEEFIKHRRFREIVSNYLCYKYLIQFEDELCGINNDIVKENLKILNSNIHEVFINCLNRASKVSRYAYKELYKIGDKDKEMFDSMLEVAEEHNYFDENALSDLRILKNYIKGVELITKIEINDNNINYVISYLKSMCKRLNKDYYNKITVNWESQLRDESCEKLKYLKSLETIKNLNYAA